MKILTYAHFNSDPYFNMAFDEWMFQKVIDQGSLICLRLYSWSVGTITLGFNQQYHKAFDSSKVGTTPVIRRVTGGRGLFHDESELTYSIALSADLIDKTIVSESISAASSDIAKILIQFLNHFDISSDYVRQSHECEKNKDFFLKAPCFASFSKNEIVADNQKIIASAQRRVLGALLQHGSIKIKGIKQHDALSPDGFKSLGIKEIARLTDQEFQLYLPLFFKTFAKAFNAETLESVMSMNEEKSLEKRKNLVLQKSAEKRDFIKQSEGKLSL